MFLHHSHFTKIVVVNKCFKNDAAISCLACITREILDPKNLHDVYEQAMYYDFEPY